MFRSQSVFRLLSIGAVAALLCASAASGQPACPPDSSGQPDPRCSFVMSFSGIVCHARWCKDDPTESDHPCTAPNRQRAIVIEGDAIAMRHSPMLFVPPTVQKESLRDASGQIVQCNVNNCWVAMVDMRIRIRPVPGPDAVPTIDPTFTHLVPHLRKDLKGGNLRDVMFSNDIPGTDVSGYVEMDAGGRLTACAFSRLAVFEDAAHVIRGSCRPFAQEVQWTGDVPGFAVLEIQSPATRPGWKQVIMNNSGPLWARIETVSTARRSTEHFVLNQKLLLSGGVLPAIDLCDKTTHDNSCTDVEIDVPGCSDSGWPQ